MNMDVSPKQEEEVQGENWHMCKRKLCRDMKKLKWGWGKRWNIKKEEEEGK